MWTVQDVESRLGRGLVPAKSATKTGTKINYWCHPMYVADCGAIQRYDSAGNMGQAHKRLMYNFIDQQMSKIARVGSSR
jgi:hypothetical protein